MGAFRTSDQARRRAGTVGLTLCALIPSAAVPQSLPQFGLYGTPSLIDMPTAEMAPDATLSTTLSHFAGTTRTTLTFQLLPRLTGSFRYSAIQDLAVPGYTKSSYYDRSFDLRYQILTETGNRPAVAIGLQDFIGTGLYGGEYIVASKAILPKLRLTGGLGWGRLGSYGSFGSTGTRPTELIGQGGVPTYDRWFRGDVAAFGGLTWTPTKQLAVKLEYSSDAYTEEVASGIIDRKSPWNFGIDYTLRNGTQLSLYSLYGSEVGAQITFHTNPKIASVPGGNESAPLPVARRSAADLRDLGWQTDDIAVQNLHTRMKDALKGEDLIYEGMTLTATTATLRLRNRRYGEEPQALGRAARAMTRILPGSIETFTIVPIVNGMAMSAVSFSRSDLENLENSAASELLARTEVRDAYGLAPKAEQGLYPALNWSFSPYLALSVFDPDNPVRADFGMRLQADYNLAPNWVLSGAIAKKLTGNLDSVIRPIPSSLPRVRTDYAQYSKEGDPAIEHLTLSAFGRPGQNLYSRLTVGYLESMYAGVSGEILWKPVDSRLALGAELNYVKQRDFDQQFGLRDYDTFTGHVSAYYDMGYGFHGQLDVGRYLAGDVGATMTLDREFSNGWRVGAYATFTNVEFDDFGEGSFDKGIRVTIPIGWAIGSASRKSNTVNIQSLTRDGGARVNVRDRLYERVRDYHSPELAKEWGRVWR
ncbi:YjbH domain-containing protein [Thalassovita taeanensis]|uniref:Exopolysaccharide biosynthesis protein YbjH n=1 Tax=Thalassovita taeanensis TaxID=657014 RepID=A0A1H9HFV1_9RHOB|nr:YjbH domain-containing protein [Thalassovita taeanensis]SEQ61241.1 Exopolysaccharide biosynthesis protein YbjH [Thalassovita taeanensis]